MRITNKKELKEFLLDRVNQAEIFKYNDPSRYDAINDICGAILKNYLKYVNSDPGDNLTLIRSECTSIYIQFLKDQFNLPSDLTKEERHWMNEIVDFLQGLTQDQEKIVQSWKLILEYWDTYPTHIKDWTKLRHIKRNLQTIIVILKNRRKNGRSQKTEQASQDFKDIASDLAARSGKEGGEGG